MPKTSLKKLKKPMKFLGTMTKKQPMTVLVTLASMVNSGGGGGGGGGFGDVFGDVFGDIFGGGGGGRGGPARGSDLRYDLQLDLEDACVARPYRSMCRL